MSELRATLLQGIEQLSLTLNDTQVDLLLEYLEQLAKWNKVYNLTSIRDKAEMVTLHLLDSLAIVHEVEQIEVHNRIIDVGTGGGLPGMVLAICFPHSQIELVDARDKKVRFLRQAIAQLGLSNAKAVHTRIEAYQVEEKFDLVTTRAFSSLKEMLGLTTHLCHTDGSFLAMKGQFPKQEIDQIPDNYQLLWTKPLTVPGLNAERHLLRIQAT